MADEEGLRKEALRRHLQGEPAAIIAGFSGPAPARSRQ